LCLVENLAFALRSDNEKRKTFACYRSSNADLWTYPHFATGLEHTEKYVRASNSDIDRNMEQLLRDIRDKNKADDPTSLKRNAKNIIDLEYIIFHLSE